MGWAYSCPRLNALIEDGGRVETGDHARGVALGLEASLGKGPEMGEERATLAGEKVVLRAGKARGGAGAFWMTAITRPRGKRLVSCASAGAGREPCAAVLEWLAGRPWRADPAADALL